MITIDWNILSKVQDIFGCKLLDGVIPKISLLGEIGIIWLVFAAVLFIKPKYRPLSVLIVVCLIVELIVGNGILKHLFARLRPFDQSNHAEWVQYLGANFKLKINPPIDHYSFPSGHAFSCGICATIITLYKKKLGFIAIPIALIMCFSRIYLCVHFPSDVFAGLIIGIVLAIVVWNVYRKFFEEKLNKAFKLDRA